MKEEGGKGRKQVQRSEEAFRKIIYELGFYRTQADEIQKQMNSIQLAIEETEAGLETLKSLRDLKEDALFPVGAGVFVKARASDKERVLADVGARVVAEKKVEDAIGTLEERKKELNESLQNLQNSLGVVLKRIDFLNSKAQEIHSSLEEGMANV
ncbi:prefoldin subunit alpha [Candidatus Micrarchaeota archaeon]|nr:prefoldin subunit alpha [Candidatus Micrarchaeota archaeon]